MDYAKSAREILEKLVNQENTSQDVALETMVNLIDRLINILQEQAVELSDLKSTIDILFPDLKIIDGMAESDDEKNEMLSKYLNLNTDYLLK